MSRGRPNAYENKIKPRLDDIKSLLEQGCSDREIAKRLDIGYSTWLKYKSEFLEFREFLDDNRTGVIAEIEAKMYQSAVGFSKEIKKAIKVKDIVYDNGKKLSETERIEYYIEEVYYPPNVNAGSFLLKNWSKNDYSNNPAELELKKQELELKKTLAEDEW